MKIANALERALHLEVLIRIEEEEQTPRIAAIRRDETETITDLVNRLVQQISVGKENNTRSSDSRRDNSHWEDRDAMETDIRNKVQETDRELPPQD